ncbi:MAG TPA: hypothetical protein VL137_16350 [Polyangiaceae bacterium]|nr:hypothetical protein [Polyangiaceae bacterium]
MFRNFALASTALFGFGLSGIGLQGCSDPSPPSAEAALATAVATSGTCGSSRSYLSLGESSATLTPTNAGTGRVTNGQAGASVQCTVKKTDTGFTIDASIEADALEKNANGVPYHQRFTLSSKYTGFTPGGSSVASVGAFDTVHQFNAADTNCTLTPSSFGNDGSGGAILATFNCTDFKDSNSPTNVCTFHGTLVLENCAK